MKEQFELDNIIDREKFMALREYLRKTRLYDPHKSLEESKDYAFARSSIEKLMPSIEPSEVSRMYHQINYFRGLAWIQLRNINDCFSEVSEEGDMDFINDIDTPRIYCTFHMSSYRMPLFKILERGVDLSIVLASNTLKQQQESLIVAHEEIKKKRDLKNTLSFIDAESPTGAIQMVRALKEGKSLFFWIDGNTGVGGIKRNDHKMVAINFFGAKMFARKGVAFIAHKCKVPIIMSLCHYVSDDEMKVTYYPPIIQDYNLEINQSSEITTQLIYNHFSDVLEKYPAQWDGWISLPNFLDTHDFLQKHKNTLVVIPDKKYVFNKTRFYHFNYKGSQCLLDKNTFLIYPISQELLDILLKDEVFIYEKNTLPNDVFEFLVKKEMIELLKN